MRIGIIGAGNVGGALAQRLVQVGHDVRLAASNPSSSRLAASVQASGATPATTLGAATFAELAILAVPFSAVAATLTEPVAQALSGKILVDVTNPLSADYLSLTVGHTTSAGEQVASLARGARVVKGFNTVMAATLASPVLGGQRQLVPVAGDDDASKHVVIALAEQLGFDALDLGDLTTARHLEATVEVLIHLAYAKGHGPEIGLALART